jgi:hypothetical protein
MDVPRRYTWALLDDLDDFLGVLLTYLSVIVVSGTLVCLGGTPLATDSIQLSLCLGFC